MSVRGRFGDYIVDEVSDLANLVASEGFKAVVLTNGPLYYTYLNGAWTLKADTFEYADLASFPLTGVSNRIYIAQDTDLTYRWDGAGYVPVGAGGSFSGTMDDIPDGENYVKSENNLTDTLVSEWNEKEEGGAAATALSSANSYTDSELGSLASSVSSALAGKQDVPTGTPDGTKFLRDDNTWQDLPSSGDPWTYVVLESDFTISTTANNAVTGLAFTPAANTRYLIEGLYLLRTATTTVGARPGHSWPTGYTDGSSSVFAPNSNTASAQQWRNAGTTANAASTGLPATTASYMATMQALLIMGGSPSGNFQVTLASETGGTNVTMKAGSLIRYREY